MRRKLPFIIAIIFILNFYCCNSPTPEHHAIDAKSGTEILSAKEVYQRNVNKTVTVITQKGLGSGFFIDSNIIVTNYHVIESVDKAEILLNNSEKKYAVIGYLAVDKVNDLILLQIEEKNNGFIAMADKMPQPGEKIYAIGSPVGLNKTISEGIISGVRDFESKKLLQITAPISHGSSGCPILNESGNLVGVAVGGITEASNIGFCIPINFLKSLIDFKETYFKELSGLKANNTNTSQGNNNPSESDEKNPIANTNQSKNESQQDKINARYLGKHLFNAYFLDGYEKFGSATIDFKNGQYYLNANQKNKDGNYVKLNGIITIENLDQFVFKGQISANYPVYHFGKNYEKIYDSPDCEWSGTAIFQVLYKGGKYWRLHEGGGCYEYTGDIDLFFN